MNDLISSLRGAGDDDGTWFRQNIRTNFSMREGDFLQKPKRSRSMNINCMDFAHVVGYHLAQMRKKGEYLEQANGLPPDAIRRNLIDV